ncbi:MAG: hypothetical protein S4CHLAM123_00390 [Chlamydiales bacterium]|nr:hypothetical protein [Chlamydiales bacterium]
MRVALVHDWFTVYAGAERVVEEILTIFPKADLFSVVDFFPQALRQKHLLNKQVTTTFIQRLPFSKKIFKACLPLMPIAIEQLDVTGYDLVISSSTAVAKGVLIAPDQRHICYCNSPLRYAWDLQHQYLKGKKRPLTRYLLHKLRLWDVRTSNSVDAFIGNSQFIARRIEKCYRRKAEVIYPPVAIEDFPLQQQKQEYYVTLSRLVSYKKVDAIIGAFALMPDKRLIVIGEGPEGKKLKKMATKNVSFAGHLPQPALAKCIGEARAFIFAACEDFGIAPLEAQSTGTAVIAYGKGGVKETCAQTGVFFMEQSPQSIAQAVEQYELAQPLSPLRCRQNAERFSKERFRAEFLKLVGI